MLEVVICIVLLGNTVGIAVPEDCPASSPCFCVGQDIRCSNSSLSLIPVFHGTIQSYRNIFLDNNHITSIRLNPFANIRTTGEVYVSLEGNAVSVVTDDAFVAFENKTLSLNLNRNRLVALPNALKNLTNLKEFWVGGVHSLDPQLMFKLGSSLEVFHLGMDGVASDWPSELRFLRTLKHLVVQDMKMDVIPDSAFHGFEHSLNHLEFISSNLNRFPDGICKLNNLHRLFWTTGHNTRKRTITPTCQQPLGALNHLKVRDLTLDSFPDVFQLFPNITVLEVSGNPSLRFIEEGKIPGDTKLSDLNLSGNGLRQIPWALRKMVFLSSLDLSYNEITTIEGNDLFGLPPIESLYLHGNPIDFLSEFAFQNASALRYLDIRQTNLTTIPKAILHMTNATTIDLGGNNIECTCDLSWITGWAILNSVNLLGNCLISSEPIANFIKNDLKSCL